MTKEEYISTEDYGYDANRGIWSKYYKKFLKGYIRNDGYLNVRLKCIDGKQRIFYLHRALWYLVYGPIPEGYEINHLDENKQNNRLSNLSLTSHVENCNYATRNERVAAKQSKAVVALDNEGNVVHEFPSTMEAERQMGFKHQNVSACCNNCYYGSNYYKGYYWYFKEDYLRMKGVA